MEGDLWILVNGGGELWELVSDRGGALDIG